MRAADDPSHRNSGGKAALWSIKQGKGRSGNLTALAPGHATSQRITRMCPYLVLLSKLASLPNVTWVHATALYNTCFPLTNASISGPTFATSNRIVAGDNRWAIGFPNYLRRPEMGHLGSLRVIYRKVLDEGWATHLRWGAGAKFERPSK